LDIVVAICRAAGPQEKKDKQEGNSGGLLDVGGGGGANSFSFFSSEACGFLASLAKAINTSFSHSIYDQVKYDWLTV
jgi:hypothetical protein